MNYLPPPTSRVRGIVALMAMIATFIAADPWILGAAWFAVLLPLAFVVGVGRQHSRFVLMIVLPLSVILVVVWGWLVSAPPGMPLGSDASGGVKYACLVALRLLSVGAIFQLCFLAVPERMWLHLLHSWGLSISFATIVVASLALLPEVRRRADQIATSYKARGLINRSWYRNAIGVPTLLAPLVTWSLRSAHQRAEIAWGQRPILANLQAIALSHAERRTSWLDGLYLSLAVAYFLVLSGWWGALI